MQEHIAPSVETTTTKGSLITKKRMLTNKNGKFLGNFGRYYCQCKQYWSKSKILQAFEGALGFYMTRRLKLRWDKRREMPRKTLLTLELYDDLSCC